ncbi:MAG TPA: nitrilase-related carbon-nitrogen hydrolase, partial [Polyangiales bacterium]
MTTTQVAVLQMTSTSDVGANLDQAEALVAKAASFGARLAVLPEGFAYMAPDGDQLKVAESLPDGGPILARCRALAQRHQLELVLGGFWERAPDGQRIHNACIHLTADGSVRSVYRKIHLFDVQLSDGTTLRESAGVAPGERTVVTDTAFGKLGLSICYDLRFPELYRQLVDQG